MSWCHKENEVKGTGRAKEFSVVAVSGGKGELEMISSKMFLVKDRSVCP